MKLWTLVLWWLFLLVNLAEWVCFGGVPNLGASLLCMGGLFSYLEKKQRI